MAASARRHNKNAARGTQALKKTSKRKIIIAGLNAHVMKSIFAEKTENIVFDFTVISRHEYFALTQKDIPTDAWLVIVLEPNSIDIDKIIYDLAKQLFDNRVILISSVSALWTGSGYGYVKRKKQREFMARAFNFSIMRFGFPISVFKQSAPEILSISPYQAVTSMAMFETSLDKIISGLETISDAFLFQQSVHHSFGIKLISKFYAMMAMITGNHRWLLRPIDGVLKFFSFKGYGYSYWSKKQIIQTKLFSEKGLID